MQDHQRYFPVRDARRQADEPLHHGREYREPRSGQGSRRQRARRAAALADAAFFWDTRSPASGSNARREALKSVTFQAKLGSLFDKSRARRPRSRRASPKSHRRRRGAARSAPRELSKCDLLTAMVGEFPELQGLMGKYYAQHDGEHAEVCAALEEQYLPRFAGDRLPETQAGHRARRSPTSSTRSPAFSRSARSRPVRAIRSGCAAPRSASCARSLERALDLDLRQLIESAVAAAAGRGAAGQSPRRSGRTSMERLRSPISKATPAARSPPKCSTRCLRVEPRSPLDIDVRLRALESFLALPEAHSLAAANKRIANILRKAPTRSDRCGRHEPLAGSRRAAAVRARLSMERAVNPLFARREYAQALTQLASLRDDVDRFFDSVMVMAEDAGRARESAGLLLRLRGLFLQVADLVAPAGLSGEPACSCCAHCCSRRGCSSARCSTPSRSSALGWLPSQQALRASRAAGRGRSCGCSRRSAV